MELPRRHSSESVYGFPERSDRGGNVCGTIPCAEIESESKGKEGGAVKLFLGRLALVSVLPDCLVLFCFSPVAAIKHPDKVT